MSEKKDITGLEFLGVLFIIGWVVYTFIITLSYFNPQHHC